MRPDPCSTAPCPARGLPWTSGDEHQSWGLGSFLSDSSPGLCLEGLRSKDRRPGLDCAPWRVLPGPMEFNPLPCPEGSLQASSYPAAEGQGTGSPRHVARQPGGRVGAQPRCPARDGVGSGVMGSQHSQRAGEMGAQQQQKSYVSPLLLPNPPAVSQGCCPAQPTQRL